MLQYSSLKAEFVYDAFIIPADAFTVYIRLCMKVNGQHYVIVCDDVSV